MDESMDNCSTLRSSKTTAQLADGRRGTGVSRRRFLAMASALAGVTALAACGGNNTPTSTSAPLSPTTAAGAASPVSAGSAVASTTIAPTIQATTGPTQAAATGAKGGNLVFGLATDANSLDPRQGSAQESNIMTVNIMDGLVRFKPGNVEIEPALAEKWNISSDNLVYTFNLRSGVKFHDGTPFNADAVVTYFNSFLDKTSPYYIDGKFVYTDDTYGNFINRVEKVDDATVKITLKQVYAPFLANLALASGGILSPDALKKYGNDIGTNPVGTGPFKLSTAANWVRDNQLTLDANPDHWRGRPALDKVVFRIVPESSVRLEALQKGDLHIAWGLTPKDIQAAAKDPTLNVLEQPGLNTCNADFNVTKKPFTNRAVRQALNYAVNKEELSKALYNNAMVPAGGVVPPVDLAYNPNLKGYPFDPEKAKTLLKQAGYDNSNPLKFVMSAYTVSRGYNPVGEGLATAVQEYFKNVGVSATIETTEWTAYLKMRRDGKPVFAFGGWQGDNGDPDNFLSLLDGQNASGWNTSFYNNPQVNNLLAQGHNHTDPAQRKQFYQQAEQIIVDDAPWVFIGYMKQQIPVRKNVQNFVPQPTYLYYLDKTSLTG